MYPMPPQRRPGTSFADIVGYILIGLATPFLAVTLGFVLLSFAAVGASGDGEAAGFLFMTFLFVGVIPCIGGLLLFIPGIIFIVVQLGRARAVRTGPVRFIGFVVGLIGFLVSVIAFTPALTDLRQASFTLAQGALVAAALVSALAIVISIVELALARSATGLHFLGLLLGVAGVTLVIFYVGAALSLGNFLGAAPTSWAG
jgi:hypothetical protein